MIKEIALWFALSFICGSLPTAYILGRVLKKVDIRKLGSGNVGATNAFRVLGKGPGSAVFIIDFFKGFLPTYLSISFYGLAQEWAVWVGLGAILGHIFTPFLSFKGGKGVATGAGVLAASSGGLFIIAFVAWLALFLTTRIVAVSSMGCLGVLFLASLMFGAPTHNVVFYGVVFALIVWTHRSNIQRLIKGREPRS